MKSEIVLGQPSWKFSSDRVDAALTCQGGHLGPVKFGLGKRVVAPFSVAPWAEEDLARQLDPLLQSLRGDFFCAPFGQGERAWRQEEHPPHGESANAGWHFESLQQQKGATEIALSLATKVRPGRIDKLIRLRDGDTSLYCRHTLSGMEGPMNLGHHATLKFSAREGAGLISTSPIRFAQVYPGRFEDPAAGGYSSLKAGAVFSRLDRVPTLDGSSADLSRYPARRGFDDLVMMVHEARKDFAWTAVVFPEESYVWFSLKDPRVLRSTVFWISNGGRHYAPWNGRHVDVMGLEDVTSYFHKGLAASVARNSINRRGFPTTCRLEQGHPFTVSYIMGVAEIPKGFQRVRKIVPATNSVELISTSKQKVKVPVDVSFLY